MELLLSCLVCPYGGLWHTIGTSRLAFLVSGTEGTIWYSGEVLLAVAPSSLLYPVNPLIELLCLMSGKVAQLQLTPQPTLLSGVGDHCKTELP